MSSTGGTVPTGAAGSASAADLDGVETILRRGGSGLRERMIRTERHLERVAAEAGEPLASHATGTVLAGGKRLRPLLVVLAAESAGPDPCRPDHEPAEGGTEQRTASCARPWRSSWCIRRRSCTTM